MGQEHLRNKGEVSGAQQGVSVCPGLSQRAGSAQTARMVVKHLLISGCTDCGKSLKDPQSSADVFLINTKSFSRSSPSTCITVLAAIDFSFQINPQICLIINGC